jgi:acyl carrier protein
MVVDAKTVSEAVCAYIRDSVLEGKGKFSADMSLTDAGLDSVAIMETLLFVERTFGVAVPDEDLTVDNLRTASSLAACVARLSKPSV